MMNMKPLYARAGASAIAAVLALSSTPVVAQEAPVPSEPAPVTTSTPAPTPDVAPTTTATPDPLAPVKIESTTPKTAMSKAKTTSTHAAPPKKIAAAPARSTTRTPAQRPASSPATATAVPLPPPVSAPTVVEPEPVATPAPPVAQRNADNLDTMMEFGGGALALLLLGGGAALALRRSRRREDEEMAFADESFEPEPVVAEPDLAASPQHDPIFDNQPAVYAPSASAFGWGNTHPTEQASDDESDRRPGETWVERAYRGPTPANPSVSLKARLKRAVFFDKREREVAAGTAVAVEPGAGLPDNLDDSTDAQDRNLEVA